MVPVRFKRFFIGLILALGTAVSVSGCAPTTQHFGPLTVTAAIKGTDFEMTDGALLPFRQWGDAQHPKAVIVALHGFNDYSKSFEMPGEWWAKHGLLTIAYDQRGFGAAPRPGIFPAKGVLKDDLETVVALVRVRHPGVPLYLVGESMGSAVVMLAVADGLKADGIVLSAPAVWGWSVMNPFYKITLSVAAHVLPGDHVTGGGLGIVACSNRQVLIAMGRDPLVIKETRIDAVYALVSLMDRAYDTAPDMPKRTLLLYGDHDEVIPAPAIKNLRKKLPDWVTYETVPGGYHMLFRDLDAERVWKIVANWISDNGSKEAAAETRTVPEP